MQALKRLIRRRSLPVSAAGYRRPERKGARPKPRPRTGRVDAGASADRREVALEPLLRQLLDGAVLDGGRDRLVEHRLEVGVGLAQADADALAEHAADEARPDHDEVLELRLLGAGAQGRGIRRDEVDATGREVEVMGLGALVLPHRHVALEVLLDEV